MESGSQYTAIYLDADGKTREKRFGSLGETREFFRKLAEAGYSRPAVPAAPRGKPEDRIGEIDALLAGLYSKAASGLGEGEVRTVVSLELEKAYWEAR